MLSNITAKVYQYAFPQSEAEYSLWTDFFPFDQVVGMQVERYLVMVFGSPFWHMFVAGVIGYWAHGSIDNIKFFFELLKANKHLREIENFAKNFALKSHSEVIDELLMNTNKYERISELLAIAQQLKSDNWILTPEELRAIELLTNLLNEVADEREEREEANEVNGCSITMDEEEEVPRPFLDPFSYQSMIDPVVTPSGISYERASILRWINSHGTDPLTHKPLRQRQLYPNRQLLEAGELLKIEAKNHKIIPDDRQEVFRP